MCVDIKHWKRISMNYCKIATLCTQNIHPSDSYKVSVVNAFYNPLKIHRKSHVEKPPVMLYQRWHNIMGTHDILPTLAKYHGYP